MIAERFKFPDRQDLDNKPQRVAVTGNGLQQEQILKQTSTAPKIPINKITRKINLDLSDERCFQKSTITSVKSEDQNSRQLLDIIV